MNAPTAAQGTGNLQLRWVPPRNPLTIAPITSTLRSIPTEVVFTEDDGLPNR